MMTDAETAQFVHQALFRSPAADLSASINDYLARALYQSATDAQQWEVPQPMTSPDANWLFSFQVKEWLSVNDARIKFDLPMYVSSIWTPVSGASKAEIKAGKRR
ncbi:MAG TPA: hypothetical protein VG755_44965 [Nannocystaceae bacterium]|nr:hypothetical protein [Nannocystaceae bacterium]